MYFVSLFFPKNSSRSELSVSSLLLTVHIVMLSTLMLDHERQLVNVMLQHYLKINLGVIKHLYLVLRTLPPIPISSLLESSDSWFK